MQRLAPASERTDAREPLLEAGLPDDIVASWLAAWPVASADFKGDGEAFSRFWKIGADLLAGLPKKPARTAKEQRAAELIFEIGRAARDRFLIRHVEALYRALTKNYANFVRVERLVYDAAALVPGLAPTMAEVAAEAEHPQKDKDGVEIDQGILLSRLLEHPRAGMHLCHAMLLPRAESLARLPQFLERGSLAMKTATVERRGKASFVTLRHPRFLNAEDESTIDEMETAIDLATLDPETAIAVFRGGVIEHPKYNGRRIFCSGINLTHLYHGKIGYLWYIRRDIGDRKSVV